MEHIINHLEKIQNSVQVQPEQMPLKNGGLSSEENKFFDSLKSPRLKEANPEQLNQTLRFVMVKVGIRGNNLPDAFETNILFTHIIDNYGSHTLDEFKLAFELALTGKLDCEVNTYENFSCAYVSQIMNAYRTWAKQVYEYKEKADTKQIEYKPDIEKINQEYEAFLQTDLGKILNPKI